MPTCRKSAAKMIFIGYLVDPALLEVLVCRVSNDPVARVDPSASPLAPLVDLVKIVFTTVQDFIMQRKLYFLM